MAGSPAGTGAPLVVGHSPDADDAFMFYGLARGLVDVEGLEFRHRIEDIETLNRLARAGALDVTAVSLNAYTRLGGRYLILNSGGSFGCGYGPIVVTREPITPEALRSRRIAVPGLNTTAFLTLQLRLGSFDYIEVPFDRIFNYVATGRAEAGLIIHEGQLTWRDEGFHCVLDLGCWWDEVAGGLPLPLGINVVRRDLGPDVCRRVDRALRRSVRYAVEHTDEALAYALRWGRGLDDARGRRFVEMYVNELTLETGERGRPAIEAFLARAAEAGLIPLAARAEFVAL